ncbi:metal ABC transporter substrate-binding protein [Chloroflexota bacterium]
MKKFPILFTSLLVLGLVTTSFIAGCAKEDNSKLKVVASTSIISQIVERTGGDKVDVVNIIPPAQCPGHFDVKPGDIQKLADADLFFLHGWQGEQFSQKLIDSANNPDLTVVVMNIQGNWMTPSVQQMAVEEITVALTNIDAENSSYYQKSATGYKDMVAAKEAEIKASLAQTDLSAINVMCADQQAGFVKWAGFNIIATFGEPESLTPQIIKDLVDKGREAGVTLIIDNMQSGIDAGAGIAEEIGSDRIILSNFPGGYENTGTWEKAIDRNVELILGTLKQ